MAKIVFGMNQTLDGYVDHEAFAPDGALFRHFIDHMGEVAGSVYGRRMYEIMRYWDEDQADWDAPEREFASAWRRQPKWVVSRTLTSVGPNATLVDGDPVALVRRLKAEVEGEIEVAGPKLAASVAELVDEYRIYLHPVVIGRGNPFFADAPPPLRLVGSERFGDVLRLVYAPARA